MREKKDKIMMHPKGPAAKNHGRAGEKKPVVFIEKHLILYNYFIY